ncbi:MAG: hypothetical protein ABI868_21615 [Acidobacteriota bacterium]
MKPHRPAFPGRLRRSLGSAPAIWKNATARVVLAAGLACAAPAAAQTGPPIDLSAATIEELLTIQITTASRVPEGIAAAPARIQVVTAAQIERRGYRSVLDVLKTWSTSRSTWLGIRTIRFNSPSRARRGRTS